MEILKRIVVAIDFSVYSPQILEYAGELAERTSAEIIAVNIINKKMTRSILEFLDELYRLLILKFIVPVR